MFDTFLKVLDGVVFFIIAAEFAVGDGLDLEIWHFWGDIKDYYYE